MLGPPVCIPCMRVMDFEHKPDCGDHHYWRCDICGIDAMEEDNSLRGNLWLLSKENIKIACGDNIAVYESTMILLEYYSKQ